ncbi:disease resistance protein RPP2B [Brassica rapa]|uniref:ADP-ribosyl cyclase/cyclic ADP-ribose hydrolase n=2 Tax=Brassica campestris TaxID=3711 RepID=M4D7T1_BRACM|nr:disease resistance protein RPP2B [Brassica rapa]ACP30627.1 disease resistance protein [Brassica rapa subsp. pekinensis]
MAAASSCKSDPSRRQYDVFLSFRGADTRHSFTCYLLDFLRRKGIDAFIDEELRRGNDLSGLLERIEQSKISIVVFSENYANSAWCLEELAKIMDCKRTFDQVVLPVFYKVPASDVRYQTGKFGAPFERSEEVFQGSEHRVPAWKEALRAASDIAGYVLPERSPECDFVDKIAKETFKVLNKLSPSEFRGLPGIESRMMELEKLIDFEETSCVRIVGVLGMAGIGKTTVADCVYKQNYNRFDGYCFLANVQNESKLHGLDHLQRKLLRKLLDEDNLDVGAPEGAHDAFKDRLGNKKLFIVLDDVANENQLRNLIGGAGKELYREGTRIVITTSNKKLLEKVVNETYVVPRLSGRESLELFCLSAFSSNLCATPELMDLSNKFVDYSKGHPLALKLLGSDLCQRDKSYWKLKWERLQRRPDGKIHDVLKVCYEELCEEEQSIFLDVACFFRSEKLDFVSSVLSTHHTDASTLISDLIDKCLITVSDNRLEMHDLLLTMGREVGYESSIKEAGNRGRLWNQEDICRVLKYKTGTAEIRGIFLDMSNVDSMKLSADIFARMWNLKFLKFYNSHCSKWCENDCRLRFPKGLDCFPDELVYLHWQGYPLEYLPSNFNPKKLVYLNLRYSNIMQLCEDEKNTGELRWVDLSYSKELMNLTGLLEARKLERLNLENCTSLTKCSAIRQMDSLVSLNLRDCINLKSLPKRISLKSLKFVILSGCSKLKKFPTISENIESLYLDGTAVKRVPESIENLQKLTVLNLKKCSRLMHLPTTLCKLKSLKELLLSGCSKLESFPDINEDMESLEILLMDDTAIKQTPRKMDMSNLKLFSFGGSKVHDLTCLELLPFSGCSRLSDMYLTDCNLYKLPDSFSCLSLLQTLCLSRNNIKNLPGSIKKLHHLKSLYLKHCQQLVSLPVLPSNLQYLDAHGCISLETVAKPMTLLVVAERNQSTFVFTDCFKLNRDAQESIVAHTQLKSQILGNGSLQRNHKGLVSEPLASASFPGNDLPLWFRHQRMGSSMETHLPPHWCDDKFIGLSLCVVVSFKDYVDKTNRFSVICKCKFRNEDGDCISFTCNLGGWKEQCGSSSSREEEPRKLTSDHVFISYNNCFHAKKSHDLNRCCNTTASFKFFVTDGVSKRKLDCCEVVKCGMSLLYAPDENDCRLQGLHESSLEKAVSGKETETAMDEAVVSKRGRFCIQEEELINGKRIKEELSFAEYECSVHRYIEPAKPNIW